MLHLTKNKPKHLIKVQDAPFLSYLFDHLLEAGYKELILVVGYKKESIKKFLEKTSYPVTLVDQFEVVGKKNYGTACAVKCVEDVVGEDDFLMVYGDNLYSPQDLRSFNITDGYTYVAGMIHSHPEKYGVLKHNQKGFLEEIIEKPKEPVGDLINVGLYKLTPNIFDGIAQIELSERGEYELTDAINFLAKENKVKIKRIKDYWLDFGNPADIMRVSSFLENENN